VKTVDEGFTAANRQSVRLKSDLRVLQQERDSLKHELAVLHKQLQNANDKVRFHLVFSRISNEVGGNPQNKKGVSCL